MERLFPDGIEYVICHWQGYLFSITALLCALTSLCFYLGCMINNGYLETPKKAIIVNRCAIVIGIITGYLGFSYFY